MADITALANAQSELGQFITQLFNNFKKEKIELRTAANTAKFQSSLNNLISQFNKNHAELEQLKEVEPDHPYFAQAYHEQVEATYNNFRLKIEERLKDTSADKPQQHLLATTATDSKQFEMSKTIRLHAATIKTLARLLESIEEEVGALHSRAYFTQKLKTVNEYWDQIVSLHREIVLESLDTDQLQEEYRDIEDRYQSVSIQLQEGLDQQLAADYGGSYQLPKINNDTNNIASRKPTSTEKEFVQTLSSKKLNAISQLSPLNTFLEVTQQDCGFFECFQEDLPQGYAASITQILAKLCSLPVDEFKRDFLTAFIKSEIFQRQVSSVLEECVYKNPEKKVFLLQTNGFKFLNDIITILKDVNRLNLTNQIFCNFVRSILDNLKIVERKFFYAQQEISNIYEKMLREGTDQQEKEIYPTLEELTSPDMMEIKPNIVEGKYGSVTHYLDIQKCLLREDFISPLRKVTAELRAMSSANKFSTYQVYTNVRFMLGDIFNSKTHKRDMVLVDLIPDQRNRATPLVKPDNTLVNSKKFMTGSLLCFSSSFEFQDLILAIVSKQDIDMISKGYIQVEIMKIFNTVHIFETELVMFESEVFFEPYHHVYRVLQSLDESNFPMANYIVYVEENHHPPDYLQSTNKKAYKFKKHTFNPLDLQSYPSADSLAFNTSQLEAYKHAISNKFSLIQGPPGAGKTFIGLQIVSTLLANVKAQILVICYTNQALDQFLCGILNITDNIVRMGNQSRNEVLDKYNIKQMTDSNILDRRLKFCFYKLRNEYAKKLQEFENIQIKYGQRDSNYNKFLKNQEDLRNISRKLDELKQISEYYLIKNKRVIGMTTTCAARCNLLLQLLKTPIVVIEEAAEVLESHIVASLTKETQHVILVGDHQQLRPTTSEYKLSKKYKMDISLLERMVNNNLNCVCLNMQYRMRQEIADLLRPTIYNNLVDHESVHSYPNITGVAKNVFLVSHNQKEKKSGDESTRRNAYEAQYLVALADYLLMQGYQCEDILFLTLYNGQMLQILNERKKFPKTQKVKVTVVDNFQGQECKIVLLSLVRSNEENKIGYLSMRNRICVSLSRALEGLYIVGNIDFLARNNSIWKEIKDKLEANEEVGDSLPLYCQRHNVTLHIKAPSEFKMMKLGGCQQPCAFEMPCGHRCTYTCHWSGIEHFVDCKCD